MFLQCERRGSQGLGANQERGYFTARTHPRGAGAWVGAGAAARAMLLLFLLTFLSSLWPPGASLVAGRQSLPHRRHKIAARRWPK